MASVRLICTTKPYAGEEWILKRVRRGLLLLDVEDEKVTLIPNGDAGLRIQFPSFWASQSALVIETGKGKLFAFEPKAKTLEKVKALIQDCTGSDPGAAASAYRSMATRDLLIGSASFLFGVGVTCAGFFLANPDGRFYVLTGFIVVGLIEIVRGIYYAIKAAQVGEAETMEEDVGDLEYESG